MQTNYLSIIPVILNPKFRRVLELWTKMCKTSRPPICCVHSQWRGDVTVQLARYARQALYAEIGPSALFFVTLWK